MKKQLKSVLDMLHHADKHSIRMIQITSVVFSGQYQPRQIKQDKCACFAIVGV